MSSRSSFPGLLLGVAGAVAVAVSAAATPMPIAVVYQNQKMMGDPAAGKVTFSRCAICHAVAPGANRIGPTLFGVVGRKAGTVPGFSYSGANVKSGIVWTEQKIFDYLENPQKLVPGTKMAFAGLPRPQDRADVVAYLSVLHK
jgi:cytochrome c